MNRTDMKQKTAVVAVLLALAAAASASAQTVVTPGNYLALGWDTYTSNTATWAFIDGPGTPPLGTGSFEMQTGAGITPVPGNRGGGKFACQVRRFRRFWYMVVMADSAVLPKARRSGQLLLQTLDPTISSLLPLVPSGSPHLDALPTHLRFYRRVAPIVRFRQLLPAGEAWHA